MFPPNNYGVTGTSQRTIVHYASLKLPFSEFSKKRKAITLDNGVFRSAFHGIQSHQMATDETGESPFEEEG
jgi:hypothetical protein